jgi:hypothetical protein
MFIVKDYLKEKNGSINVKSFGGENYFNIIPNDRSKLRIEECGFKTTVKDFIELVDEKDDNIKDILQGKHILFVKFYQLNYKHEARKKISVSLRANIKCIIKTLLSEDEEISELKEYHDSFKPEDGYLTNLILKGGIISKEDLIKNFKIKNKPLPIFLAKGKYQQSENEYEIQNSDTEEITSQMKNKLKIKNSNIEDTTSQMEEKLKIGAPNFSDEDDEEIKYE